MQVRLYARNVEHVGDEDPLHGLPLQGDGSATLDRLQRPVESTHVLHIVARRHVDEDRLRPHQVVGATFVEQHRHRVCLHSCRHRLEVLASLQRQRDRQLHYADHRAQRLPIASALATGIVDVLRQRCLLLLTRLRILTWVTAGRSTVASLGVVLVAVIAVRALVGMVVGVMADPALPPSTTTSSALVPRRPLLVDVLRRPSPSATTSARLLALLLMTIQLHRYSVTRKWKEVRGLLSPLHCLVLEDVAGEGVLVEGFTCAGHHRHPLHEVVAARQALEDVGVPRLVG
ncbi:unnamed protein product, partial [Closterium sp. NIES-54]